MGGNPTGPLGGGGQTIRHWPRPGLGPEKEELGGKGDAELGVGAHAAHCGQEPQVPHSHQQWKCGAIASDGGQGWRCGVLPCACPELGAGAMRTPGAGVKAAQAWGEMGLRKATRPWSVTLSLDLYTNQPFLQPPK